MKKSIALVVALVLCVSATFAENTFHIGAYFPISSMYVVDIDDGDSEDVATSGVGGSLYYTHVADGGFTFKVGFGVGYVTTGDVKDIRGNDMKGVDIECGMGFGGSFIHNEKMTLSLTGNVGFRVQSFVSKEEYSYHGYTVDVETDYLSFLFYIGPEISYTFRFNEHIGLFASAGVFFDAGASAYKVDIDGYDDSTGLGTVGITFQPKVGLAVTF